MKKSSQEYLSMWWRTPHDEKLRKLAEEYHELTEAFDQLHCQHKNERGIAIPETPKERMACEQHARRVWRKLWYYEVEPLGFTKNQWHSAVASAALKSYDRH